MFAGPLAKFAAKPTPSFGPGIGGPRANPFNDPLEGFGNLGSLTPIAGVEMQMSTGRGIEGTGMGIEMGTTVGTSPNSRKSPQINAAKIILNTDSDEIVDETGGYSSEGFDDEGDIYGFGETRAMSQPKPKPSSTHLKLCKQCLVLGCQRQVLVQLLARR